MAQRLSATIIALALLGTTGCADTEEQPRQSSPTTTRSPSPTPPPPPSPKSVRANELGDVPVLMYHRITSEPESVYDRTPEDFRAELERLATEDYVPITASEYATGKIDIPAGKHPVVLTFDDGSSTQFALNSSGQPKTGTAVAILLSVARQHPGFRTVATFYVFDPPFEEPAGRATLTWLNKHGFEIGNHTLDHPNLSQISGPEARHQISGMHRIITNAVPGIQVRSLALPLGVHPDDEDLASRGEAEGIRYNYNSVMLVGSNPAPSPWAADFDPANVPRIRSQGPDGSEAEFGSTVWLDKLAANPDSRYTADGDPHRISAPADAGEPGPSVGDRLHRY